MISVISPIYNERENLEELCRRVAAALGGAGEEFELILVENGSTDGSLETLKDLRRADPRIKYLRLSRNFGHQAALLAGMGRAKGSAVVSLDGDLQHPPELIPRLIQHWKDGYDVVFTTKKNPKGDTALRGFLKRIFYKLMGYTSAVKLVYGQSDFRLLDRKVADVILAIPERNKFLRGIVSWVGFAQKGIEYEADPRKAGRSKFSLWNYLSFASDGIFSFSTVPLRAFLWLGLLISALCMVWGAYYVVMGVINLIDPVRGLLPPGSATITVSILFLGGIQLIGIGVLGEYLARIYTQTKERPDFIVAEEGMD